MKSLLFPEQRHRIHRRWTILSNRFGNALSWRLGGERRYTERYREICGQHRWCFIVGCNNSGTTLLQRLLDASGQVSTFDFEGQLYSEIMFTRARPGSERLFTEHLEDIALDASSSMAPAPRLVHDWMRSLKKPIKPTVVEKTPANFLRMCWMDKVFPDARFIGLVRNGYAVCEGIRRKAGQPLDRAARHWNTCNELLLSNSTQVRHFLPLTYETLVDTPEIAAGLLAEFLDVDEQALVRATARTDYAAVTVAGAGRFGLRNMNAMSLERLCAQDREVISREAAPMLRHFGYLEKG